ncbi:MAG: M10 family metallopeptidase C-terminal domain-containing protein, partial [Pseudomonadota bacterium]
TYIHEIGHALGLGHAGPYNGNGSFSQDASFDADSWQATTMSYFAQTENPNVDASFAYAITTMPADILAIRTLYGTSGQTRTGDTTYWNNSTAGGVLDDLTSYNNPVTATIIDDGGHDTLDFSNETVAQTIHAYGGGVSDVGGLTGNLIIYYDTVIEDVVGGSGADVIHGSDVANSFVAGGGNDTLWLLGGADAGFGNAGDDTLYGGDGDDELRGGSGGDLLVGGDGVDTVVYTTTAAVTLSLRTDQVQDTGEGADTLRQIENAETGDGNDQILGSAADNRLSGGDGDDRLEGGNGNDTLIGGSGNDVLYGEAGDDTLEGGAGDDDLFGADGADTLRGQDGDDLLQGGFGDDTIAGGAGRDIALFRKPGADATVDLAISGAQDTGYGLDTLSDIEVLISGAGADRLSGDNAANNIQARDGADEVFGRGGDDLLFGGTGDDRISGGSGDDRIHGRQDDDILTGGGGADIFVFETSDGDDRITDFEDGLDLLRFRDVSGFDDVEIIDRGTDTEIRAGGTTVLLEDVAAGLLGADDFDFV